MQDGSVSLSIYPREARRPERVGATSSNKTISKLTAMLEIISTPLFGEPIRLQGSWQSRARNVPRCNIFKALEGTLQEHFPILVLSVPNFQVALSVRCK